MGCRGTARWVSNGRNCPRDPLPSAAAIFSSHLRRAIRRRWRDYPARDSLDGITDSGELERADYPVIASRCVNFFAEDCEDRRAKQAAG